MNSVRLRLTVKQNIRMASRPAADCKKRSGMQLDRHRGKYYSSALLDLFSTANSAGAVAFRTSVLDYIGFYPRIDSFPKNQRFPISGHVAVHR